MGIWSHWVVGDERREVICGLIWGLASPGRVSPASVFVCNHNSIASPPAPEALGRIWASLHGSPSRDRRKGPRGLLIHHSCTESQRKSHLGAALGNMVGDGWGTCLRQIPHSRPHSRLGQSQENLVLYCASSSLPWA